ARTARHRTMTWICGKRSIRPQSFISLRQKTPRLSTNAKRSKWRPLSARAIHQDKEVGSLEAGKRADLIIVDMDSAHQTPVYNVYSHLAYATKAADVRTVIINGRVVMLNRRVLTIDERTVLAKANEYRDRIRKSLKQ